MWGVRNYGPARVGDLFSRFPVAYAADLAWVPGDRA
jgi:hypothetical protein